MSSLKRKRRVYKNGCANPLFVKWVEEWRDDARERGVSSHYSYTKVITLQLPSVESEMRSNHVVSPLLGSEFSKEVSPTTKKRTRG